MEHNSNISARAATDEQALPSPCAAGGPVAPAPGEPQFATEAEAKAWWAGVNHGLRSVGAEEPGETASQPGPDGRRLREDGWLPWKKARFLEALAAGAAVADACKAVGMSVASAYALRNRRSGRAFAAMWEAVLVHRARARLVDNNLSRAMDGWVEQIVRDGIVVAERRRFDNRLSMAMLTRLDRLAEGREGEEAELLRALSDDFEDYVETLEAGGDEDAFVEARRPQPEPGESGRPHCRRDDLDTLAALSGCRDWRHVPFGEVPVGGLDPERIEDWDIEDWVRAERSHFLAWLELMTMSGQDLPPGPECPAAYDRIRRGILATIATQAGDAMAEPEQPGRPAAAASPVLGKGETE
jgi:hypothetical protein